MESDEVLALLQEVAEQVVNPRFRALRDDQVAEKHPGDPVTVADREAEALITAALLGAYPDAVVLGEEASESDPEVFARYAAAEHAFTVDPIDGTKNFIAGSPDHAVMVAESRGHRVVRSWIWQPQHETAYVAELGSGAFRNGERLTRPPAGDPPQGAVSWRSWIGRELGDLPALTLTWVCCGVDYPKLVEGATDYLLYGTAKPWDHAPGSLLTTEAGGWLGLPDGRDYQPQAPIPERMVVAADRATYEQVISAL